VIYCGELGKWRKGFALFVESPSGEGLFVSDLQLPGLRRSFFTMSVERNISNLFGKPIFAGMVYLGMRSLIFTAMSMKA